MKSSLPAQCERLQPSVSGHAIDSTAQKLIQPAGFSDQRPATLAHIQRQQLADRSPQARQLQTISAIMNRQPAPVLQRVEEELQGKFQTAQRREEDDPVQAKGQDEAATPAPAMTATSNETGLPNQLKAGVESLSGISLDAVKVHYNSAQPAQLNAHAYAQGTDIHIGPGQEKHLPHEAWHVVQQAQGRVRPTMQMKAGVAINDDSGLESEADIMGTRAVALGGGQVGSQTLVSKLPDIQGVVPQARQLAMQTGVPVQLTRDDAGAYVYRNRDAFYGIKELAESVLFKDCKPKGEWMNKWEITFPEEDEKENYIVQLEDHVKENVDRNWVKKWVASTTLAPKFRLGLYYAWNEGLDYDSEESDSEESEEDEDEEKEHKENGESEELSSEDNNSEDNDSEDNGISLDLIADLVKDVSSLDLGKDRKLKRSDSFSFKGGVSVPKPKDLLDEMDGKVTLETGVGIKKDYPCTTSIRLAGLYIRAYGDDANSKGREASTKFVFDLGGSLGVYRDTTGNGDLFYFPLVEKDDEKGVYKQEGGSTAHTWDKLAGHLFKVDGLKEVHIRLAKVLESNFKGTLSKSEVIAIGAMLADAKYSIQGWLYAVEKLKSFKFDGKEISKLFAVTGNPFWKYSLNASNVKNKKPETEMGRKAGVGYKALDLKEQKKEEKQEKEEKEKEKEIKFIAFEDFEDEEDDEENEKKDYGKGERKEQRSPHFKPETKSKAIKKSKQPSSNNLFDKKRKIEKAEFKKEGKHKKKKITGKPYSDEKEELKIEEVENTKVDEDFEEEIKIEEGKEFEWEEYLDENEGLEDVEEEEEESDKNDVKFTDKID